MEITFDDILGFLTVILVLYLLWFLPIRFGLKWAKIKGVSNLWMLFGIHPFMRWAAYLIIKYGIDPRKECDKCKESIKMEAQICRYCGNQMSEEEINLAIEAFENRKNPITYKLNERHKFNRD